MSDDKGLTDEEKRLWQQINADTKKFCPDEATKLQERAEPEKEDIGQQYKKEDGYVSAKVTTKPSLPPLQIGKCEGLDKRTAQRMAAGKLPIDAQLDLHGYKLQEAYEHLLYFIEKCSARGARNLLIITGKGKIEGSGVIRENTPNWLNEPQIREKIIAVTYADRKNGGEGALFVLLRRK